MTDDMLIVQHQSIPARVRLTPGIWKRAVSDDAEADNRFYFDAIISNTGVDAYFTRMDGATLANFAAACGTGIALLDSHGYTLPVGYSISADVETGERGEQYVVARFYIIPGLRFGIGYSYQTSDDLIAAIQGGLVRDVSVGFYGGDWTCDICGRDYLAWWSENGCTHVAGMEYQVPGDDGIMRNVVATVTIRGAELSEVSLVYDGATPGAAIIKAERQAEGGMLGHADRMAIETRYRIKLPQGENMKRNKREVDGTEPQEADTPLLGVADLEVDGDESIEIDPAEEPVVGADPELEDSDDAPEDEADEEEDGDFEERAAITNVIAERDGLRAKVTALRRELGEKDAEIVRLRPLADAGIQYRGDLIDAAIAAGVRAQGNAFPSEQYRGLLAKAGLDEIKAIRDSFEGIAASRLPEGRQTVDTGKRSNGTNKATIETPSAAFG